MYMDVLSTAVRDWNSQENNELMVTFPERDRHRVLELLRS